MKQVIRCLGCNEIKRFYGSYKIRLRERVKNLITGRIKFSLVEGRICKKCSKKMSAR
jgi:hypothetical protein